MPYISASIVIQLLGIAVPYFQKLQREGESGRRKMNQYTRYLTIAILLVQAPSYLLNLKMQAGPSLNASLDWTLFMFTSTITNTFICDSFTKPQDKHTSSCKNNGRSNHEQSPI